MKNMKVSALVLSIVGAVLAESAKAEVSVSSVERKSVEAALVLRNLQAAGLVRIDSETGLIQMKGSVLEVLRATGWAADMEFAENNGGGRTWRTDSPRP